MESNKSFVNGSIWRKWDLHIHSDAGSIDSIIEKLIEKNISVFAITDHCNVDNIDECLKKTEIKRKEKKEIYFLSGIELRTDKGDKSVHLVGIFPDKDKNGNKIDSAYLKQNLLSKIDCSDTDIRSAGKAVLGEKSSDEECISRGRLEIVVDFEKATSQIKELGGITIVHAGLKSSGIETEMKHAHSEDKCELLNTLGHTKRSLMKKYIDVCELSNWNDANLDEREFYIKEFGKPSIIGSDSHALADIGKKYSWIKADPTFEGLRQITYEPKLRVALQEKPITYLFSRILSIKLKGWKEYEGQKDKDEFPPINMTDEVLFSSNLTNIIGPRGSGKTVLVEMLSYIFDHNQKESRKNEKLPLIQYLAKRFPKLSIEIKYQNGENEPQYVERKISEYQDPFYNAPLKIEYWAQGTIEQIADKKEHLDEYIRGKLESSYLNGLAHTIDKIKDELKQLRCNYLTRIDIEIEKKKYITEKKQIEEYFDKLKSDEYKGIVKRIRKNRENIQLVKSLAENISKLIEILEDASSQIGATVLPEKQKILNIFKEQELAGEIDKYYSYNKLGLTSTITKCKKIIDKITNSKEYASLLKEEKDLKEEFIRYSEKCGININQAEYEKKTKRLNFVNEQLRSIEAKINEYDLIVIKRATLNTQLKEAYDEWIKENEKINKEFNKEYAKTDIKIEWCDATNILAEWVKDQFMASDADTKNVIKKYYNVSSPARENYIGEIITELVETKKYALIKIIEYLKEKRLPPVIRSMGKEENLRWFFQRDETRILRDDLIMRLEEFAERTINLIKYKGKVLGKDSMSFGERCGTVIEMIMQSGDYPIVIDQPEEHLDSKFITGRVIEILQLNKSNRQIIICTHNANIVVLGDSELVTVLDVEKDGTNCCQGSIENPIIKSLIYNVLEGGEAAFKKREQKYGFSAH
ncbi:MAG: TrlF family AAA-like ATPase [Candidatus Aminicenantales bacterium]